MTRLEVAVDESQDRNLEAYIAAAAQALELPVEAAWLPAVKANLQVTLRLAGEVAAFPLSDEAEPASVFEA
jgi:Protein of unknown function (DUF4089)